MPGLLIKLRKELDGSVPGVRCVVKQLEQGPPVEEPIQIRISGENLDQLRQLADQAKAAVRAAGAYHVFDDLGLRMPNIQIDIDQVKAEYRDGILALFLPRAEQDKPRSIKIL